MGQVLRKLHEIEVERVDKDKENGIHTVSTFPNLTELPPELSYLILSNLNATDLCLASCVWDDLANDELLWMGLCKNAWPYVSIYFKEKEPGFSYKKLYLRLDEAVLTFNSNPNEGIDYMIKHGLINNSPSEIARFLHKGRHIAWKAKRDYLNDRRDVLDYLIQLQSFERQFLPNALRRFFGQIHAPNSRGSYLHVLVDKFAERFCECNPEVGLPKDSVYVICFSLIMLSVDLSSPHVKNKMSKREFIRNTRQAAQGVNDDFAGHLYDNIYLVGHVAPEV
ncbi:F-box only protein 8-like [Tubulanus polymorphus]|uniref:F-box only protein 8-like n=1 Tax=Tubulanus polymorphus TaxID=672921 RepID=UPI003DA1E42E